MPGTTIYGVSAEWEYTTLPWGNFEQFDAANPMRFLANASSPTLVIHGQSDKRVPYRQGRTLYRALKDVDCRVKMLAYPREPHGFREPAHTRHFLEVWADRYEIYAGPEKAGISKKRLEESGALHR